MLYRYTPTPTLPNTYIAFSVDEASAELAEIAVLVFHADAWAEEAHRHTHPPNHLRTHDDENILFLLGVFGEHGVGDLITGIELEISA